MEPRRAGLQFNSLLKRVKRFLDPARLFERTAKIIVPGCKRGLLFDHLGVFRN